MIESILTSVKKNLGLAAEDTSFDEDVLTHINSTFLSLDQIGIGPEGGFLIEDADAEWWDLLGDDPRLNAVKTLVYLKVKLLFDPPQTSFTQAAFEKQIEQLEWRLMIHVDPQPVVVLVTED